MGIWDIFFNLPHDGFIARLFAFLGAGDNCCFEIVVLDSDGTVTVLCSVPLETRLLSTRFPFADRCARSGYIAAGRVRSTRSSRSDQAPGSRPCVEMSGATPARYCGRVAVRQNAGASLGRPATRHRPRLLEPAWRRWFTEQTASYAGLNDRFADVSPKSILSDPFTPPTLR
jgi:hypothetical protein